VKYTTARAQAEEAVTRASEKLGRGAPRPVSAEPPLRWARPLEGSLAERTRVAVEDEMARTLSDAVLRRLDLGTAGPPPPSEVDEVARAMAAALGWDAARVEAEKRALAAFYEDAYNGTEV
jgi:glycerol-3-phosphate dehydrogenase